MKKNNLNPKLYGSIKTNTDNYGSVNVRKRYRYSHLKSFEKRLKSIDEIDVYYKFKVFFENILSFRPQSMHCGCETQMFYL